MAEGPTFGLRPCSCARDRFSLSSDYSCACSSRTPTWQPQSSGWSAYASSDWPPVETSDDTRNSGGLLHSSAWQPLQDTKQGQTYSYQPADFLHHTWGNSTEVSAGANLEAPSAMSVESESKTDFATSVSNGVQGRTQPSRSPCADWLEDSGTQSFAAYKWTQPATTSATESRLVQQQQQYQTCGSSNQQRSWEPPTAPGIWDDAESGGNGRADRRSRKSSSRSPVPYYGNKDSLQRQRASIGQVQSFVPTLAWRTICPTPYYLGLVCGRGEREFPGWRRARDSNEILGPYAQLMYNTAQYIFDVICGGQACNTVRLLSAADGVADDRQTDIQARYVPTSVMLAHAYASSSGVWQDSRTMVRLYGGDVRNPCMPWWQPQALPWQMPIWLQHRFVALDNTHDLSVQLSNGAQCVDQPLFDVVLVRQGLCFCDDPSKTSPAWPTEVLVSRSQDSAVCGLYHLEPLLVEGRPAYRKGHILLKWCTARGEWAVLDAAGGAWACVRGDVGHPVLARGPWTVWNGHAHVTDASFACDLAMPGTPPWQKPPPQRMCCCGVPGDALSVFSLLQRVAALLDTRQLHSFGLLHGAWTNGTKCEVEQLHQQIEEAARLFNEHRAGLHVAAVLRRTAAKEYWLQCDGIILFQPSSRADPFKAYETPLHGSSSL